jgi:hypothetical protein
MAEFEELENKIKEYLVKHDYYEYWDNNISFKLSLTSRVNTYVLQLFVNNKEIKYYEYKQLNECLNIIKTFKNGLNTDIYENIDKGILYLINNYHKDIEYVIDNYFINNKRNIKYIFEKELFGIKLKVIMYYNNIHYHINLIINGRLLFNINAKGFKTLPELIDFYHNLEANYKLIDGKLYDKEEAELVQIFKNL